MELAGKLEGEKAELEVKEEVATLATAGENPNRLGTSKEDPDLEPAAMASAGQTHDPLDTSKEDAELSNKNTMQGASSSERSHASCMCIQRPHDVEKVVGRICTEGEDLVCVQWKCTGESSFLSLRDVSLKWPKPLIQYYERLMLKRHDAIRRKELGEEEEEEESDLSD